jgi:hypothetical protein
MTSSVSDIIQKNYASYVDALTGERERHRWRLLCQVLVALVVAAFIKPLSDDNISVAVTGLSILMGFAFSAMFPIADTYSGLPNPIFSEDRDDLKRIKTLSKYFRCNVGYFIPLSLLCIIVLLMQMMELEFPASLKAYLGSAAVKLGLENHDTTVLSLSLNRAAMAVSTFLILEVGYTFYRMTANALYALRIREEYRDGHFGRGDDYPSDVSEGGGPATQIGRQFRDQL